ncbi:cytochrome-c peroxidase [Photobacterium profundum]|uniref:Di-haem cytochrome c peroxidase n=1 Tax=Photobacterium profundum 3TCK TaxID=314280 RepID=Q1YWH3_9GAMM|nr:cytochrome c peroxidase [Photobacterium profundum]EAS40629.1 Di-haem cytochrome c peroxidase [Photobacterium profundum 3TCK]PSV62204.1 cytochrome-c peroxidase [Photobacterium profundum]
MKIVKNRRLVSLSIIVFYISTPAYAEQLTSQVELGRYLFNDVRLSKFGNRSCGLCHSSDHGWTNTFSRTIDINDRVSTLNTPSLLNVGKYPLYMQRSIGLNDLEETIMLPLFSQQPKEMGMTETLLLERLNKSKEIYGPLFEQSFGNEKVTTGRVLTALSAYVNTIQSTDTAYQRYRDGDLQALDAQQKKGMRLFNSERLKCSQCHGGELLNQPTGGEPFANTGLYGLPISEEEYSYPRKETGLEKFTGNKSDNGKFRIPSLINVTNTGPWGHDGSFRHLGTVIDTYSAGGRQTTFGPNTGDGRLHPNKDQRIQGFSMTAEQKQQLLSFLSALAVPETAFSSGHQSPFCSLIPLKNKPDAKGCLPPFFYKKPNASMALSNEGIEQ